MPPPTPALQHTRHSAAHNVRERWSLLDLKLGIMFLRSLYKTGLAPSESLEEMARLQPKHVDHWRAAARHTKSGKPLYQYLEGRWPESLVTPIKVGETTGRLEEVFFGMEKTLQQQMEARKLLNKMYYPLAIIVGGISAATFMITFVIPALMGKMRFDREPTILTLAKAAQNLIADYGYAALASIIALIAVGIWKWHEDDDFKKTTLSIINRVPGLGSATRWVWFSVWAKYVSIMIKADILFTDIFPLTASTLPHHLRGAVARISTQLDRGKSLSDAVTPSNDPDDPRHLLPIHIINAFRMTDRSGHGDVQFSIASETLFEPGKEMLAMSIQTITYILMSISAVLVVTPFALYLQTVGTLVRSIGH